MPFTRGHALLIGVGAYAMMPYFNVRQTAADAEALAAVLRDPDLCGYPAEQVQVLCGAGATLAAVRAALQALAKLQPHDTVLIFYAGHGMKGTDGNYYLTTHDSQLRVADLLKGSGLEAGEFLTALQAIPAQRLLLLINACYGGQLSPDLAGGLATAAQPSYVVTPPLPTDAREAALSAGSGRILITSCAPGEQAQTGQGDNTLFGQALVDAFNGNGIGPSKRAGTIGAFDLFQAVQADVTDKAAALGKQQHPEITVLRGAGSFPVAIYRGAQDIGTAPVEPLPAAGVNMVEPERSRRMLASLVNIDTIHIGDTYTQNITGSGNAVAQGPGATATVNNSTVINSSPFNQAGQTVGTQYNIYGTPPPGVLPTGSPGVPTSTEPPIPESGQLSSADLSQLQAALLSAFTAGELERVVFFGLGTRLYDITARGPYPDEVFALVTWTAGRGKLRQLLDAARKENPGNRALAACDATFKACGI